MVTTEDPPTLKAPVDGPLAQKIKQVDELAENAAQSGVVVFADYSGLTVTEMSELRKKLAGIGADLRVVKNTLLRLALEKAALAGGELEGPTAAMFSRGADPIESIKTLALFLKEKGKGAVKFGFFEKALVKMARIEELAKIPSKSVLQVRLVSQLESPIFRLVYVLSAQPQKLGLVLDRVAVSTGLKATLSGVEWVVKSKGGDIQ